MSEAILLEVIPLFRATDSHKLLWADNDNCCKTRYNLAQPLRKPMQPASDLSKPGGLAFRGDASAGVPSAPSKKEEQKPEAMLILLFAVSGSGLRALGWDVRPSPQILGPPTALKR